METEANMARKADSNRIEEIGRYVEQYPDSRPFDIAKGLHLPAFTIARYLPTLEEEGILLSEDDQGRLSFFGKRR